MPLTSGTKLGPYEILSPIGAGGMGEVYRAHDSRLGRDVAVKISAGPFTERFERKARAVAALNHPDICTLHDVGPNFLVMELLEGPTLAELIAQGPMPMKKRCGSPERLLLRWRQPTRRESRFSTSAWPKRKRQRPPRQRILQRSLEPRSPE